MNKHEEIGARVRATRGSLSVNEFAAQLGVNRKTISRWESGEAVPDGASLLALNEKFGAAPDWLLTGDDAPRGAPSLDPEHQALLNNYDACSPLDQAAIRALSASAAKFHTMTSPKTRKKRARSTD